METKAIVEEKIIVTHNEKEYIFIFPKNGTLGEGLDVILHLSKVFIENITNTANKVKEEAEKVNPAPVPAEKPKD